MSGNRHYDSLFLFNDTTNTEIYTLSLHDALPIYNWRALVESDISRWKRFMGDGLRFQTDGRQATEVAIAADVLNRMLDETVQNLGGERNRDVIAAAVGPASRCIGFSPGGVESPPTPQVLDGLSSPCSL